MDASIFDVDSVLTMVALLNDNSDSGGGCFPRNETDGSQLVHSMKGHRVHHAQMIHVAHAVHTYQQIAF